MKPMTPAFRYAAERLAEEFSTECFNVLHDCFPRFIGPRWRAHCRYSWSRHRIRSWGGVRAGRPYVNIAMMGAVATAPDEFKEYPSISRDPVIGSFDAFTWHETLRATLAHEIAHAAGIHMLYVFGDQALDEIGPGLNGHGQGWQEVYRSLRFRLVNPRIGANALDQIESLPTTVAANSPLRHKRR